MAELPVKRGAEVGSHASKRTGPSSPLFAALPFEECGSCGEAWWVCECGELLDFLVAPSRRIVTVRVKPGIL